MNRCNGNERNFSIEVNEVVRLMFQDIPHVKHAYHNETERTRFSVALLVGEDPGAWAWEKSQGP